MFGLDSTQVSKPRNRLSEQREMMLVQTVWYYCNEWAEERKAAYLDRVNRTDPRRKQMNPTAQVIGFSSWDCRIPQDCMGWRGLLMQWPKIKQCPQHPRKFKVWGDNFQSAWGLHCPLITTCLTTSSPISLQRSFTWQLPADRTRIEFPESSCDN